MDDVVIFPCPLLRKTEVSDSTAWLRDEKVFQVHGSKPRIVLAHGGVHGFTTPSDDEESDASVSNHINLSRLPLAEIDYIALGDWHGTKQISDKAWYAGTPEHDRFPKGGDHQPGHVLVVDVNRGGLLHVEQIATARLGWNELSFEFAGDDGPDHLQNELSNLLETRTGQDLLRLSLEGSLGIEAYSQMERILETWEARLLRLKLDNKTRIAPSEQEIAALTQSGRRVRSCFLMNCLPSHAQHILQPRLPVPKTDALVNASTTASPIPAKTLRKSWPHRSTNTRRSLADDGDADVRRADVFVFWPQTGKADGKGRQKGRGKNKSPVPEQLQ